MMYSMDSPRPGSRWDVKSTPLELMLLVCPISATRSAPERVRESGSWSLKRLVFRCSIDQSLDVSGWNLARSIGTGLHRRRKVLRGVLVVAVRVKYRGAGAPRYLGQLIQP